MTDLLTRLRAVNPVPACDPPTIEDVWRKLEHENEVPGRTAPRQRRRGLRGQRGRARSFWRVRLRVGQVGLGLAVAVPVLVGALAIALLGHSQRNPPAPHSRPAQSKSARTTPRSVDAALAAGVHPLAPHASMALPVLGSKRTRSLQSFRGKVVVLNVFASWCDLCRAAAATLEQAQTHIAGHEATVLGVSYEDNPAASEAFVRAAHITYPVLRDKRGRFARSFGLSGVPATFVIDQSGRIVAVRFGPITRSWLTQTLARVLPGSSTGPVSPIGMATKSPPTASQLAAMAKAYPVLARHQQLTDIPPYGVLDPSVISQGGLIANTRRALVTTRGESLYIVAAHQSICIVSSDNDVQGCQPFPYTATPRQTSARPCALPTSHQPSSKSPD
jgi:cytochrome c biogenesis protein CcmG/thiol:disulfide interchange protein DsbE